MDNNNFKHSLSQKVYEKQKNNNITKHNTNSLNNINFSLKKKKINNFNLFKNYKKELEKINEGYYDLESDICGIKRGLNAGPGTVQINSRNANTKRKKAKKMKKKKKKIPKN